LGSGSGFWCFFGLWIRDPEWKKIQYGIRDKHPGLATLVKTKEILLHFYPETFERICGPDTGQSKLNFKHTAVLHLLYSKKTNLYIIILRIV